MKSSKSSSPSKRSQLARVYPDPLKNKKKNETTNGKATIPVPQLKKVLSSTKLVSKTPYGDMMQPTLKKVTNIKVLNAERLKFNGTVSTDRVLFKMLLSNQIHTVLNLEKFHHILDQAKFFQALTMVLEQLNGRISKFLIGGSYAIDTNYIRVNVNQPVIEYNGSSQLYAEEDADLKEVLNSNNVKDELPSKGPLENYRLESRMGSSCESSFRGDETRWKTTEDSNMLDMNITDIPYYNEEHGDAFPNSTLENTVGSQNTTKSGFVFPRSGSILQQSTTIEVEKPHVVPSKKYVIIDESCLYIAKCLVFMKEVWIRGMRLGTPGMDYFASQLEEIGTEGKSEINVLGFIGTQNSEGHGMSLAKMIKSNVKSLKQIIFNRNIITDEEFDAILDALACNENLQAMNLSQNFISGDSIDKFASFLKRQTESSSNVRKWSLANVNMKDEQAQKLIDGLRTNDIVTDLILSGNPDITKKTLMTLTALLDINQEIKQMKKNKKLDAVESLKTEKDKVISFYINQMEEQAKALYFLRSQKPPDFIELYALRLMRDLARLEQQLFDMQHLITEHSIEVTREPQVEKMLIVSNRVSERIFNALKNLCPRVKTDGFQSHVERYRNEVHQALLRDQKLQEETEVTLTILKEQLVVLEEEAEKIRFEKEKLERQQEIESNSSITHTTSNEELGTPPTQEIHETLEAEIENSARSKSPVDLKIDTPNLDVESNVYPQASRLEISILSNKNAELLLVAHRNKIAKLREVQARITKRWKEVDIDDLMIEQSLKDQVLDMRIQCNATDALGLFKNLERRFLPESEVSIEEERIVWIEKEKEYKETIAKLQAALEKRD